MTSAQSRVVEALKKDGFILLSFDGRVAVMRKGASRREVFPSGMLWE